MKYALVAAALAAISLATTVNIDVEGTDVSADNNRHGHNRMSRHHHHGHHHHHKHNHHGGRSWWTELFGHRNHNDRHHHRNGRDRRMDLDELLEDLFKVNFECTRQAEWSTQQFKECYRKHAEGINEDLIRRDDEIFGDYDDDEDLDEDSKNRRHRHHHHHRHGHNYEDNDQAILGSHRGHHHRQHRHRSNEYECRVQTEDPLRQDEILRQCCEEQQLGRYNPEQQTCEIEGREDKNEFQQCAYEQGVLQAECWRERRGGRGGEDEE